MGKDPTSPTAKYADQAISVEQAKGTGDQFVYFARLNMLRGL